MIEFTKIEYYEDYCLFCNKRYYWECFKYFWDLECENRR